MSRRVDITYWRYYSNAFPDITSCTYSAIRVKFMHEDPFAGEDVGANRMRDKIPSVVSDQSIILFLHDMAPRRVDEGGKDEGVHQREQQRRGGRQCEFVGRQPEAPLHPRGHWMMVNMRWHRYDLRQW
jgi:hypothetical protein